MLEVWVYVCGWEAIGVASSEEQAVSLYGCQCGRDQSCGAEAFTVDAPAGVWRQIGATDG
jgi:hypothetical protein